MKPNTFVIGAMKSGTTSLCNQLAVHPDIFMARIKEPDFFSRDEEFAKGQKYYESLFRESNGQRIVAEGSTSYTKQLQYPHAASRIHHYAPDAKLVYLVRDPIARLQSHWAHERLKGRTQLDVNAFVRSCPEAIDISNYWKQILPYLERFDASQILVLFTHELRDQPREALGRCCRFLGIRPFEMDEILSRRNATSERQLDIWPIRAFRKQRWFDVRFEKLKSRVPGSLHRTLKFFLKSNAGIGSSQLDDDTRKWAVDQLNADLGRFLQHFKRPAECWAASLQSDPDESETVGTDGPSC